MGLSEGWPSEAERLATRLQRWAAACSGYRKLRSCRISRGRQTMAQGADSDEDAAVSVGVGVGAAAAPGAAEAAAASRCLQSAVPPRRSRPVGIKMFLTADEQTAIADAKSARPKHTVAHVTGNSSGGAAGVVLLAEQRVPCRPVNRVLLVQRARPAAEDAAAAAACRSIARPRTVCPRRTQPQPPPLAPPPASLATPQPQPQPPAAPARRASADASAAREGGFDVGPTPPALRVEDAEERCGAATPGDTSSSEPDEDEEAEAAAAGKRQGGRIEVSLYSGGSQREDILSVSVEAEEPAMVRGCGVRKTAPPVSICSRRAPPSAREATAGDPAIGRELGAGGRLVTRVDPRGRRELWWVSAAPPASPTPPPPAPRSGLSEELRGLLSFRRARRLAQQQQQQLARRRVVAAADARDRRQWPAVLLTFERGVSPEPGCGPTSPAPSPHALLSARKARIEVAAV